MADSSSEEKTEKPSAQKLRKAREEGQLPRSKDMGLAASLFAAFVVISSSFPWYADFVRESFISVHQYAQEINNPQVIGQFLRHHLLILGKFILTLLPMPAAALLSSLVPGGWLFLPKKILPDFSKISPLKGIGRLFSSEHLAETGKMTVKSVVVLVMLWVSLRNNFAAFLGLQALPFKLAMNEGLSLYASVMRNFVILFIFFALLDVPLAKALFTKGLKMTKQELKEEYKNQEGKPEVKARVVLLHGHLGAGAAGKVIESFGQVVIGGNFVVGFVVFIILMIINFIVVTKGAERISEVSARFTLDAMPGKQMAIDADLNAGLINQTQAQTRRKDVASEADFYGAMDGASKFVRGDAIAGMMILAINLIGGVCIGIFKYNLSADAAFQQYVLMTIGDGLVAQIPSLLLSTAAAIIVTRVSDNGDIAHDVRNQLLASPSVLYTATGIMFVLAVVPGMPHFPFLMFSALLGFTGWRMSKRPQAAEAEEKSLETLTRTMTETSEQQVSWETIPLIEPISLSLGYKLVALVDKAQGNPLTQRIRGVRQVISDGNGVLLPEIRIRENFRLKPSQYTIFINGIKADEADIPADKLMALPSSETYGEIDGVLGNDPAYGMPVTWIQPAQKAKALNMGYQVIDSASVIATHVNKIVRSYIPDLFNYDDITQLHNRLSSMAPRLAEDLSAALNYSQLLKVYRALLTEGVSLRDIVTIATVLVASSAVTKDHILLAADVRLALRRSITHPFVRKQELTVYTLNNELENLLTNVVNQAQQGGKVMLDSVPVDPNMLNQFQITMPQVKEQMKAAGKDPVLLVPPQLRPLLARYARLFAPGLHVLSYNEVPDELELKIMGALM
ncbi:TPA: flagellar type III secretion system protein FlhA [Escherichia coli]|nr:FHIPEP family type III secretion protein [Escherichia coli]EFN8417764.1 flagellar type III secretion system protein FlhA [Escherichia coli O150]EIY2083999.1 flagellar type III secretion system protein FlhA [Escherichia coli]STM56179.1 lateral flagellar export/assembly protein (FlhA-like) [Escherichia coli]HAH8774979.1 flagellar type III secretion system protein FlhA [Escherichia coli]